MSTETDNSEPNSSGVQDNGAESPLFSPQKGACISTDLKKAVISMTPTIFYGFM